MDTKAKFKCECFIGRHNPRAVSVKQKGKTGKNEKQILGFILLSWSQLLHRNGQLVIHGMSLDRFTEILCIEVQQRLLRHWEGIYLWVPSSLPAEHSWGCQLPVFTAQCGGRNLGCQPQVEEPRASWRSHCRGRTPETDETEEIWVDT